MPARATQLQHFIEAAHNAIAARVKPGEPAGAACRRIFMALETGHARQAPHRPEPPRAWTHLQGALAAASSAGPAAALADALAAIEPQLCWQRRPGAEDVPGNFVDGHANATIVGEGGLEVRGDVRVGVSLWHRTSHILTIGIRPRSCMPCCRRGSGGRTRSRGTSPGPAAWSTITPTSCTPCDRRARHCLRSGAYGPGRIKAAAPASIGAGCAAPRARQVRGQFRYQLRRKCRRPCRSSSCR